MSDSYAKSGIIKRLLELAPIIILFISVLNEFDMNYSNFFSFNFTFILIFYWSLRRNESLGYGFIFIAGLINDVVVGFPMGISSLSYLFICVFAAYLRNITLRPNLVKDWIFFLITIFFIKSLIHLLLVLFFSFELDFYFLMVNLLFTFLMYYFFSYLFGIYSIIVFGKSYD